MQTVITDDSHAFSLQLLPFVPNIENAFREVEVSKNHMFYLCLKHAFFCLEMFLSLRFQLMWCNIKSPEEAT